MNTIKFKSIVIRYLLLTNMNFVLILLIIQVEIQINKLIYT